MTTLHLSLPPVPPGLQAPAKALTDVYLLCPIVNSGYTLTVLLSMANVNRGLPSIALPCDGWSSSHQVYIYRRVSNGNCYVYSAKKDGKGRQSACSYEAVISFPSYGSFALLLSLRLSVPGPVKAIGMCTSILVILSLFYSNRSRSSIWGFSGC